MLVGIEPYWWSAALFDDCRAVARIDDGYGVPTQEQGEPVLACSGLRAPWSEFWPSLRHVG